MRSGIAVGVGFGLLLGGCLEVLGDGEVPPVQPPHGGETANGMGTGEGEGGTDGGGPGSGALYNGFDPSKVYLIGPMEPRTTMARSDWALLDLETGEVVAGFDGYPAGIHIQSTGQAAYFRLGYSSAWVARFVQDVDFTHEEGSSSWRLKENGMENDIKAFDFEGDCGISNAIPADPIRDSAWLCGSYFLGTSGETLFDAGASALEPVIWLGEGRFLTFKYLDGAEFLGIYESGGGRASLTGVPAGSFEVRAARKVGNGAWIAIDFIVEGGFQTHRYKLEGTNLADEGPMGPVVGARLLRGQFDGDGDLWSFMEEDSEQGPVVVQRHGGTEPYEIVHDNSMVLPGYPEPFVYIRDFGGLVTGL